MNNKQLVELEQEVIDLLQVLKTEANPLPLVASFRYLFGHLRILAVTVNQEDRAYIERVLETSKRLLTSRQFENE